MRRTKYTREVLEPIVAKSSTYREVLESLGLAVTGGNHRLVASRIRQANLESRRTRTSDRAGNPRAAHRKLDIVSASPDEARATYGRTSQAADAVARTGLELLLCLVRISEWRDQRLVLHVDHINGINNDNRLENLRVLCPNCHSQTDTYCNRAREGGACYMLSPDASVLEW